MAVVHHHRISTKIPLSPESAFAADIFDQFVAAQTFKSILSTFRHLCETLRLKPNNFPVFYPKLKAKLPSWKAQALWAKFDKRSQHKCYGRAKACANKRVLIVGGGPCGLRAAIEAQLLGAKVVVVEKRDRFSRNNVLHLWPFVIHDLKALGAKKLFGKFCAGSIDHISIRQLQCILLKVCLLFGVEVHENVAFEKLIEPPVDQSEEKIGWTAQLTPSDHPVSQYEFDVLIGADGKRNTLPGFKRKEFRGKLAIAITANFINRRTELEARVEEISGVAFIFNQKFFQEMREQTGIDLENIVYYKDDTHYFVMTAKKQSLIDKGVILNDYPDTAKLLAPDNVDRQELMDYAREAADFGTSYQFPNPEFAVNHYGQADVAMFDFTSMYAAENACKVVERRGHPLLLALVGDSLLEPFWPTGSGCARGFLSSMDACWMIRCWSNGTMTLLQVLAQRESVHRLLAQTTPENLSKDLTEYTLNPQSRYPNLNLDAVRPPQVRSLYDSDSELKVDTTEFYLEMPKKRCKRGDVIHHDTLLHWCQRQVCLYDKVKIEDMTSSWKSGLALCAIVYRYRPDLIDFYSLKEEEIAKNNDLAFGICDRELGIPPVMTGEEMDACSIPDKLTMVSYVSQLYDVFRGEIPHAAQPALQRSPSDEFVPARQIEKRTATPRSVLSSRSNSRMSAGRKARGLNESRTNPALGEDRVPRKRRTLDRERALFIMNKETSLRRLVPPTGVLGNGQLTFNDRVKTLEELLCGKANPAEPDHFGNGRKLDAELHALSCLKTGESSRNQKVGRLEKGDWNVKMLEERLKEQRMKKEVESVPKWNRDCFEDKLRAMDDRTRGTTEGNERKFSDFDERLKQLDMKLKEGNRLETGQRGSNKVSAMAEQLVSVLEPKQEQPIVVQANARPPMSVGGSEICHFCLKRVYLMERVSAQSKFFHRGCFKCEYCGTALRLGSYGYAADGNFGGKFLCMQHFGIPLNFAQKPSMIRKPKTSTPVKLEQGTVESLNVVDGMPDKLRGATPERVEFEISTIVDQTLEDEVLSEMDEDEWTDHNFGTSATDMGSTDEESDLSSEEISDDEELLEEALHHSIMSDDTRWLAESWKRKHSQPTEKSEKGIVDETDEEYFESDDEFSYEQYENEGTATGSEPWSTSSPESKPDEDVFRKTKVINETESSDESDSEDSASDSGESSSNYEEEAEALVPERIVREIPSIVIDDLSPDVLCRSDEMEMEVETEVKVVAETEIETKIEETESERILDVGVGSEAKVGAEMETEIKTKVDSGGNSDDARTEVEIEDAKSYTKLDEEVEEEIAMKNESDLEIGVGTESEVEIGVGTESEVEIGVGTELEVEIGVKVEAETEMVTGVQAKTKNGQLTGEVSVNDRSEKEVELQVETEEVRAEIGDESKLDVQKAEGFTEVVMEPESNGIGSSKVEVRTTETETEMETEMDTETEPELCFSAETSDAMDSPMDQFPGVLFSEPVRVEISNLSEVSRISATDLEKVGELTRSREVEDKTPKVVLRPRDISNLRRTVATRSVIEPLQKDGSSTNSLVTPSEIRIEDKSMESASSLPNLVESGVDEPHKKENEPPVEVPYVHRMLKLKERYLLGESSPGPTTAVSIPDQKPRQKLEPVVKSFLETITEKQKMLTPSPPSVSAFTLLSSSPQWHIPLTTTPVSTVSVDSGQGTPSPAAGNTSVQQEVPSGRSELMEISDDFDEIEIDDRFVTMRKPKKEPEVLPPPPKTPVRYEGHFAKKVSPFGGVRDSIDIRKSALKRPVSLKSSSLSEAEEQVDGPTTNPRPEVTPSREEEEIPFADDDGGTPKSLRAVGREESVRQSCAEERERARQEARERARLKSDEELGLESPRFTGNRILKKLPEETEKIKKRSATWAGFGRKQTPKGKNRTESSGSGGKGKHKDRKGLLSIITSLAKGSSTGDSRKSKVGTSVVESDRGSGSRTAEEATFSVSRPAPKAAEDTLSESDNDSVVEPVTSSKQAKDLADDKLRKLHKVAAKLYRRQEQKRLRMAQEIQRQLEEAEVKQRQLELRGVEVERALRGEKGRGDGESEDETSLMSEWFCLVREKNQLARYEEELIMRAKELELEDRHNRLQQRLAERMGVEDKSKTEEEIKAEEDLVAEMLLIGEQRDAITALIEAARLRCKTDESCDDDEETHITSAVRDVSSA